MRISRESVPGQIQRYQPESRQLLLPFDCDCLYFSISFICAAFVDPQNHVQNASGRKSIGSRTHVSFMKALQPLKISLPCSLRTENFIYVVFACSQKLLNDKPGDVFSLHSHIRCQHSVVVLNLMHSLK